MKFIKGSSGSTNRGAMSMPGFGKRATSTGDDKFASTHMGKITAPKTTNTTFTKGKKPSMKGPC